MITQYILNDDLENVYDAFSEKSVPVETFIKDEIKKVANFIQIIFDGLLKAKDVFQISDVYRPTLYDLELRLYELKHDIEVLLDEIDIVQLNETHIHFTDTYSTMCKIRDPFEFDLIEPGSRFLTPEYYKKSYEQIKTELNSFSKTDMYLIVNIIEFSSETCLIPFRLITEHLLTRSSLLATNTFNFCFDAIKKLKIEHINTFFLLSFIADTYKYYCHLKNTRLKFISDTSESIIKEKYPEPYPLPEQDYLYNNTFKALRDYKRLINETS